MPAIENQETLGRVAACVLCLALTGCQKMANEVAAVSAGTVVDAGVSPLLDALEDFLAKLHAQAASSRAAMGMTCGSHNPCRQETPLPEDACDADAGTWEPDFREAFDACLVEGSAADECFAIA
jgi:hypothetical protein